MEKIEIYEVVNLFESKEEVLFGGFYDFFIANQVAEKFGPEAYVRKKTIKVFESLEEFEKFRKKKKKR